MAITLGPILKNKPENLTPSDALEVANWLIVKLALDITAGKIPRDQLLLLAAEIGPVIEDLERLRRANIAALD